MRNAKRHTFIFLALVAGAVAILLGHNAYRYLVNKDYVLTAVTVCDPQKEACFAAAPDDPNYPLPLYKKVTLQAAGAPACLDEHSCKDFSCMPNMRSCHITYCSAATKDPGERCSSDPQ